MIKIKKSLFNKNEFYNNDSFFGNSYILFSKAYFTAPDIEPAGKIKNISVNEIINMVMPKTKEFDQLFILRAEIEPACSPYKYFVSMDIVDKAASHDGHQTVLQWNYYDLMTDILSQDKTLIPVVNKLVNDGKIYLVNNNLDIVSVIMQIRK